MTLYAPLAQPAGGAIILKITVQVTYQDISPSLLSFPSPVFACPAASLHLETARGRDQTGSERAMRGGIVQTSPHSHLQCYKALKISTGAGSSDGLCSLGAASFTPLSTQELNTR